VEKLMREKNLVIYNKSIVSASEVEDLPPPVIIPQSTFPKPLSSKPISLFPSSDIQAALVKQLHSPDSIPFHFKPTEHPETCKCVLENGIKGVYKESPEVIPGKSNGHVTVWLLYGEPLSGRTMYYWRCKQNNPLCDIFYDGRDDGFLVYSTTNIVSHTIPMDFVLQLVTGKGASFSGFISHKELMNILCYGQDKKGAYLQKNNFIKVNYIYNNFLKRYCQNTKSSKRNIIKAQYHP